MHLACKFERMRRGSRGDFPASAGYNLVCSLEMSNAILDFIIEKEVAKTVANAGLRLRFTGDSSLRTQLQHYPITIILISSQKGL